MSAGSRETAERWLRLALTAVVLVAAAPLGYIATFVVLGLMAIAAADFATVRALPPAGTGFSVGLTFTALVLVVLASVGRLATGEDLIALLGFSALLFHAATVWLFAEGAAPGNSERLANCALGGAGLGLGTALFYEFGMGLRRAAEGAPFDDPTRLATTTMILGFLALMGLKSGFRSRNLLYLLGPVLGLAVALLSGSRDALLAFPILALVAAFTLPARRRLVAGSIGLAAFAACAAILWWLPIPGTFRTTLSETFASLTSGGPVADAAIAIRLKLYSLGWQEFLADPFIGHGLARVMDPIHPVMAADELAYGAVPHLHNDVLQFAVGGGILGIGAWLLVLLSPLAAALRGPSDGQSRARFYGLMVLLIGYLVMGLFDTMLASPLSLTLFVALLALLSGYCRDPA